MVIVQAEGNRLRAGKTTAALTRLRAPPNANAPVGPKREDDATAAVLQQGSVLSCGKPGTCGSCVDAWLPMPTAGHKRNRTARHNLQCNGPTRCSPCGGASWAGASPAAGRDEEAADQKSDLPACPLPSGNPNEAASWMLKQLKPRTILHKQRRAAPAYARGTRINACMYAPRYRGPDSGSRLTLCSP